MKKMSSPEPKLQKRRWMLCPVTVSSEFIWRRMLCNVTPALWRKVDAVKILLQRPCVVVKLPRCPPTCSPRRCAVSLPREPNLQLGDY